VSARKLLRLLPVARPHTGRHQRGDAPAPRPATALLAPPERKPWCLVPPPKARQRVTGPLPADITEQWKREQGNAS
jgi:hypothetical protein